MFITWFMTILVRNYRLERSKLTPGAKMKKLRADCDLRRLIDLDSLRRGPSRHDHEIVNEIKKEGQHFAALP